MDNQDSVKILSDIRDEMKEMNAQIKRLKNETIDEMRKDKINELALIELEKLKTKKAHKDLLGSIVLVGGLFVIFILEKYGYI